MFQGAYFFVFPFFPFKGEEFSGNIKRMKSLGARVERLAR
jgi:hypothetical protein